MKILSFCLYCEEIPEREKQTRQHFFERNVHPMWWRSYHGATWGLETRLEYDSGKRLPPGHVGLNLGTWALWQHALLRTEGYPNDEILIFFEDDVHLPEGFHEKLDDILAELLYVNPNWDFVFLGLAEREPHVWHKVTERIGDSDSRFCRLNDPFGTHAYMVRRRALPILIEHMRKAERNLDQQLWKYVLSKNLLNWCAVLPSLVEQRSFDHKGTGTSDWAPTTLRPDNAPDPFLNPVQTPDPVSLRTLLIDPPSAPVPFNDESGDRIGKPSPQRVKITTALIDPFPCIYRGEPMQEDGEVIATGKAVPVWQCARLNTPCHTKPNLQGIVAHGISSAPVNVCETCILRVEMPPDTARPRLPIPDGHFNPSIALYNDRLILATRDSWGHSRIALWDLFNDKEDWTGRWTARPISSLASTHSEAPRLEDPRFFIMTCPKTREPRLAAMLNLPDGYPPKVVQVGYVRFSKDLRSIEDTVVYSSPSSAMYEKNWVPFEDENSRRLHWVYSTAPEHIVLSPETGSRYVTPNSLTWTGGALRGGASPVLMSPLIAHALKYPRVFANGNEYYHFFHGCLKRLQGSVYTMGCVVFEAKPPYRVLRQTATPLLWPDLPGPGEDVVKRYVLWPGGAIPHAGHWHIALGIDDSFSRITRIPFETVEKALVNVGEQPPMVSIRQTQMVTGITKEKK